jgi:putative FmdB family regulatory protein
VPRYVFECNDCSLEFERTLKMAENLTHACPQCGEDAFRVWDGNMSFGFKGSTTGSTANTGVHVDDYPTADKVVGRDAEARWAQYHERERVKQEARALGGTHALIRRTSRDFIDYEPMTQTGRQARKELSNAVFDSMRAQRAENRKNR